MDDVARGQGRSQAKRIFNEVGQVAAAVDVRQQVFGRVHQNAAQGQNLLSTIDLLWISRLCYEHGVHLFVCLSVTLVNRDQIVQ